MRAERSTENTRIWELTHGSMRRSRTPVAGTGDYAGASSAKHGVRGVRVWCTQLRQCAVGARRGKLVALQTWAPYYCGRMQVHTDLRSSMRQHVWVGADVERRSYMWARVRLHVGAGTAAAAAGRQRWCRCGCGCGSRHRHTRQVLGVERGAGCACKRSRGIFQSAAINI